LLFRISPKASRFSSTVDSLCGVSAYKFLTNTRTLNEGKGVLPVEAINKKDDYQVVMAIVNDGFTDLVMDAAKKAGARGGTILTAQRNRQ
jgi:hypothetical protein